MPRRGYRTMCMLSGELAAADTSRWDVLGLEWNARYGVAAARDRQTHNRAHHHEREPRTRAREARPALMASWPTVHYFTGKPPPQKWAGGGFDVSISEFPSSLFNANAVARALSGR